MVERCDTCGKRICESSYFPGYVEVTIIPPGLNGRSFTSLVRLADLSCPEKRNPWILNSDGVLTGGSSLNECPPPDATLACMQRVLRSRYECLFRNLPPKR